MENKNNPMRKVEPNEGAINPNEKEIVQ